MIDDKKKQPIKPGWSEIPKSWEPKKKIARDP